VVSVFGMQASLEANVADAPVQPISRYEHFVQLVSQPRAAFGIAALAFVMSLPAIAIGLTADDFDLGRVVTTDPWAAYAFQPRDAAVRHAHLLAQRDAGVVPWWTDLDFHQAFFRPLSSLSLALDFALWPGAPWLMHVENSLLFALIVLCAASLYKALGLAPRVRGLATVFIAAEAAQSMTTGWISGRNTLLATLFGFLTLRLFIAARSGGGWRMLALSVCTFVASLASAEVGVSAVAYVLALVLCSGPQPGPTGPSAARLPVRALTRKGQLAVLTPFAVALLAYLVFYKSAGYGVKNSGFYIDPIQDPGRFLLNLAFGVPIYLGSVFTAPYAAFAAVARLAAPVLATLSVIILYASRRLWLPWVSADARGRTLGLGALLATLPLGGSPPQDRMVSFVALGVCGLVAMIVDERLGSERHALPQKGALRLLRLHAIWAPLLYVPYLFGCNALIAGGGGVLLDRVLGDDPRPVVLVNAPAFLPVHFFTEKRSWYHETQPTVDLLYGGGAELQLTRTGEKTLQLTAAVDYLASTLGELQRSPSSTPLHVGEVIPSARMRTQVLEMANGAPSRMRFDFSAPLDTVRVFAWHGRNLVPLALPEIGETVRIQRASAM
jgi:hypothetical protein